MATKYKVVKATNPDDLKDAVEDELSNGWALQGGVSVAKSPSQMQTQFVKESAGPQGVKRTTDTVKGATVRKTTKTYAQALTKTT